jgi:hypothetical protein
MRLGFPGPTGLRSLALLAMLVVAPLSGLAHAQRGAALAPALSIASRIGTVDEPLRPDDTGFSFGIATRNFSLDATQEGKVAQPGVGHWQLYVDAIDPTKPFSPSYLGRGAATTVSVTIAQLARAGVTTGTHTLYVALANNLNALLQPPVIASTVIRLGPTLWLLEHGTPANPIVIPATGKVAFHVEVSGFTLNLANMNRKVVFGEGHYHVYLDSIDQTHPFFHYITCACDGIVTPTTTFNLTAAFIAKKTSAGPGLHTLYVTLNNNDHSFVAPLTGDSTSILIQ